MFHERYDKNKSILLKIAMLLNDLNAWYTLSKKHIEYLIISPWLLKSVSKL